MEIIIDGEISKKGEDTKHNINPAKISFKVDPQTANLIVNVDGKEVFQANCQAVARAIDAFRINSY